MFNIKGSWANRIFYQQLTEALPELLYTKPECYEQFHRIDDTGTILTINIKPIRKNLFSTIFYIDETVLNKGFKKPAKNNIESPGTSIQQLGNSIASVFKPLQLLFSDLRNKVNTVGVAKKGDIQIEISDDYISQFKFNLIINHTLKSAKALSIADEKFKYRKKEPEKEPQIHYTSFTKRELFNYLRGWGIDYEKDMG